MGDRLGKFTICLRRLAQAHSAELPKMPWTTDTCSVKQMQPDQVTGVLHLSRLWRQIAFDYNKDRKEIHNGRKQEPLCTRAKEALLED